MNRRKRLRNALLILVGLLCLGSAYEQIGARLDRHRFTQIGQSVNIGGRTLNLSCVGSGSPTVVFESAAGVPGYAWTKLQSQLAKTNFACWYDRAGYGWSDPGPLPRTSSAVARDLQQLLQAAAVPKPYVLVGHSIGGLDVRVFAGMYLGEVAGLVLVDASHEDQEAYTPENMKGVANRLPRPVHALSCAMLPVMARVGVLRATASVLAARSRPKNTDEELMQFLSSRPKAIVAVGSEGCHFSDSAAEARAAGKLGDVPLIVLTAGIPYGDARFYHAWRDQLQPQLARLSTRGKQIVVEHGSHGMVADAPDAVLSAIREVIREAREDESASQAGSK